MDLESLKQELKVIKSRGFIKTLRAYQGGAGNTLEQLLGVKENNLSLPDIGKYELKVKRENTSSMLSLVSKAPLPRGINRKLFDEYHSIKKEDNIKRLYTSITTKKNPQNFYLEIEEDKLYIKNKKNIEAYWSVEELYKVLKSKVENTILVIAKTKSKTGYRNEEFYFTDAYLLSGITKESFISAIKNNTLVIDIRIGADLTGKKAGVYHDHGTAIRIKEKRYEYLFSKKEKLL